MAESPAGDPRSKTVLIVDDDEAILQLLDVLVKGAGFKLLKAANGEEAIERLGEKPDAIVMDLVMPGCGGLGVLAYLKVSTEPVPPIIVITAFENRHPTVQKALMDENVLQCLGKPINSDMLIGALHRYLKTEPLAGSEAPPPAA